MISEKRLVQALNIVSYHKIDSFIQRCKLEVDGDEKFPSEVIKDISFSMLDQDLEQKLYNILRI